ncbi:hypothetical protein GCM10009839_10210 [Catenulispora yoronensis]|uniref:Uncharacterized protein n=2 Tax=Catenulispora yoronensis TaxID=450799 RepID=A0ABN2TQE7_9ACTN
MNLQVWAAARARQLGLAGRDDGEEEGQRSNSMGFFTELMVGVGEFVKGMNDMVIINSWLEMSDQEAFGSIAVHVRDSSVEALDQLERTLLADAAARFDSSVRLRLIKFFAVFKICQSSRFEEFRAFPL